MSTVLCIHMYYISINQIKKDIENATEYVNSKENPQEYLKKVMLKQEPQGIILVNATESVFAFRSFSKIVSSGIATTEEYAYIIFCMLQAFKVSSRLAYGKILPSETISIWTEFSIKDRYFIIDPMRIDLIEAPNNSYFPFFAFDGENLIFMPENVV